MTHADLVEKARRWLLKPVNKDSYALLAWRQLRTEIENGNRWYRATRGACSIVITEMTTTTSHETPDAIGWYYDDSTLVECKASRADFLRDAKKSFRIEPHAGMGQQRYYLAPEGLLFPAEMPSGWGLLCVTPRGAVRIAKASQTFKANLSAELGLMLSTFRRIKIDPESGVAVRYYRVATTNRTTVTKLDREAKRQSLREFAQQIGATEVDDETEG